MAPTVHITGRMNTGQVLDDRFLLVEEIGRGGMSTIFRAEDLHDDRRTVVVKVPLPVFSSGIGSWSLFQREEEIGLQLDHPFVLKFLPVAVPVRQRSYVATELVPGETLHRRLKREPRLSEGEALRIAGQICDAVAHLHERGFVHYDLKPANVILCPDGSIRVIDLGLAHDIVTRRFALGAQAPAIGSAEYVAPEQIRRQRGRTSADVYSIGAILYTMLTGRPPFPDDDPFVVASARTLGDPPAPRALDPRLSREAEEIALRALRRDPRERYPSVAAMKADLDDPSRVVVTGLCDRLQPVTFGRRARRIARQILLVGVLPVATQVALFVALWHHYAHHR
ncbi:MAG TPA: serine/threonine-protein kinase [Polyangia bacterium]|nr:serine/threonine-protein kinase [Polyangia bacterium]